MLKGVYTALVTPFLENGDVDEAAFRALIDEQIAAGVAGIVPCGTTGESPTLSHEEHGKVIDIAVQQAAGKCEVMAGTGSNSTEEAIRMTKHAKEAGATSSLQVAPYYNKPTQKGIYEHFKAIAEAVDIPLVLYNIFGRTGINIETDTVVALAKIKNIVGVKEASGSIYQIMDVIRRTPDDFSVLSGDDNMTMPLIMVGGNGLVSVSSNLYPRKMVDFVDLGLSGDFTGMRRAYENEIAHIVSSFSLETNPIPIKSAMILTGKIGGGFRLPLTGPLDSTKQALETLIQKFSN